MSRVSAGIEVSEPAGIAERAGKPACGRKDADERGERNGAAGQYRRKNDKSLFNIFTRFQSGYLIEETTGRENRMRAAYPGDITRDQFSLIEYPLRPARKTTHPRKHGLYDIFCAILSVLKKGCTWRGLPHDFPRWNIEYYYSRTWSAAAGKNGEVSLFDRILGELVLSGRVISGREPKTTMIIMDSKSVKNTGTACEKGV
jgi:transposase